MAICFIRTPVMAIDKSIMKNQRFNRILITFLDLGLIFLFYLINRNMLSMNEDCNLGMFYFIVFIIGNFFTDIFGFFSKRSQLFFPFGASLIFILSAMMYVFPELFCFFCKYFG